MNQAVQQVINRFPGWEDHIRQLWQANEDFQELCHDYDLCLKTLNRWEAAKQRTEEYVSLKRRLEFEIEMKMQNGKEYDHEN